MALCLLRYFIFFRLSGNFPPHFCILFIRFALLWSPLIIVGRCLMVVTAIVVSSSRAHLHCRQFVCPFVLHTMRWGARHIAKVCRLTISLTLSYSGSRRRQVRAPQERRVINEWIVWLDNNSNNNQIEYVRRTCIGELHSTLEARRTSYNKMSGHIGWPAALIRVIFIIGYRHWLWRGR